MSAAATACRAPEQAAWRAERKYLPHRGASHSVTLVSADDSCTTSAPLRATCAKRRGGVGASGQAYGTLWYYEACRRVAAALTLAADRDFSGG